MNRGCRVLASGGYNHKIYDLPTTNAVISKQIRSPDLNWTERNERIAGSSSSRYMMDSKLQRKTKYQKVSKGSPLRPSSSSWYA
jgi:hypothetical protein